jgi:hypothetical protein
MGNARIFYRSMRGVAADESKCRRQRRGLSAVAARRKIGKRVRWGDFISWICEMDRPLVAASMSGIW